MGSCFSGGDVVLCLSEKIDDKSLESLMRQGPGDRFPKEFAEWQRRMREIKQRFEVTRTERQQEMHAMLEQNIEDIKVRLREGEAAITDVIKTFS
jgi:protein subunit release factor A